MKLIPLFILLLLSIECYSQTSAESLKEVNYKTGTRGRRLTIKVSRDSVHYLYYEGNKKEEIHRPLPDSSFHKLNQIVSAINLPALEKVEAPSYRRNRDADWYAGINIVTSVGTYTTQEFDKCSPMKEVQTLILFLEELVDVNLCSQFF